MVEGAPLLREYRVKSLIEGSNPSLSAKQSEALVLSLRYSEKEPKVQILSEQCVAICTRNAHWRCVIRTRAAHFSLKGNFAVGVRVCAITPDCIVGLLYC